MNILITGGSGFIGSNFVEYILDTEPDSKILNIDCLTYVSKGDKNNSKYWQDDRYALLKYDIRNYKAMETIFKMARPEFVVHFAAWSHVDKSLEEESGKHFVTTNVEGTYNLLQLSQKYGTKKFVSISTDEVYGSIAEGSAYEDSPLNPRNPYSASKAAADHLCNAFFNSFDLNINVTRCTNNYGKNQYHEKMIPLSIKNLIEGKPIGIYGDGSQVREWTYVKDHCAGIYAVIKNGQPGMIYNITGGHEITNLELAKILCKKLNKNENEYISFIKDRPGHDQRYSIASHRIQELGYEPRTSFDSGLDQTIDWYVKKFSKGVKK